ncbi:MAG: hypothetical protein J6A62_04470 [Oscillospiraceae bacterium]|nr:hypothetical protein [Oscillospiraceae bacterium]
MTLENRLELELRKLFDDDEFVIGVLCSAACKDERRALLEFILTDDDVSVETVTILALELNDARKERRRKKRIKKGSRRSWRQSRVRGDKL